MGAHWIRRIAASLNVTETLVETALEARDAHGKAEITTHGPPRRHDKPASDIALLPMADRKQRGATNLPSHCWTCRSALPCVCAVWETSSWHGGLVGANQVPAGSRIGTESRKQSCLATVPHMAFTSSLMMQPPICSPRLGVVP